MRGVVHRALAKLSEVTAMAEHKVAIAKAEHEVAKDKAAEAATAAKRKSAAKVKSSTARHQKKHRIYECSSDAQEEDESEEELSPASAKRVRHAKAQRWAALHEGIHDGYRKDECNSDDASTTTPYDEESDFSATTMPYDEEEPDKDELQSKAMAHTSVVDENAGFEYFYNFGDGNGFVAGSATQQAVPQGLLVDSGVVRVQGQVVDKDGAASDFDAVVEGLSNAVHTRKAR